MNVLAAAHKCIYTRAKNLWTMELDGIFNLWVGMEKKGPGSLPSGF